MKNKKIVDELLVLIDSNNNLNMFITKISLYIHMYKCTYSAENEKHPITGRESDTVIIHQNLQI